MEKVHGWTYVRSKKKVSTKPTTQSVSLATSNNLTDVAPEKTPPIPSTPAAETPAAVTDAEIDCDISETNSKSPRLFKCEYVPCAYQSKRVSNCRRHMEKVHGWMYIRSRGKRFPRSTTGNLSTPNNPTDVPPGQITTLPSFQAAGAAADAEIKGLKEIIKLREKELESIGRQNKKLRTFVSRYGDNRKRRLKWRICLQ